MIEQQLVPYPFLPIELKCQTTLSSQITSSACTLSPISTLSSSVSSLTTTTSLTLSTRKPMTTTSTTTSMSGIVAALCSACCRPICDRYIMRVVDTYYHEACLQCTSCSMRLMHSCFMRNGKLYCRIDYERIYLKKFCLGCGDRINSEELVMRTSDNVFHLKCFSCVVCGIQLQKGEQYVVKQSQLFCRMDYEKEVEMLQGFNDEYFSEEIYPSKIDGRRGPKRPRTILNTQQRRAFKASFDVSPKPCRKVRENLAKETGLSLRIVQVWFQNQRAKVKKIQKKARQETKSSSETESLGESSLENESKIKNENESDSESFLNGNLDGDHKVNVKEELESEQDRFKKALNLCTSLQNFKDDCSVSSNDMQLNTIMGLTYSAFQQLMGAPPQILNPIDRLYSMQNAYFRCDDGKFHTNEDLEN